MKLVVAIIQERDDRKVSESLGHKGFFSTKIASTGGFLRDGNETLLIGVEDDRVDEVLEIIRENSEPRDQYVSMPSPDVMPSTSLLQSPVRVTVGGAVVFVVDVESFHRW